jgi:hypothetical protein
LFLACPPCPPLPTFAHLCTPLHTFAHLCTPLHTFAHLSQGFKWARKGRGLTRRPLATTRRNASPKHSGGIRAFVRFAGRFLANESQPARRATPMPSARNARTRRSHVVAATRTSQRCIRMASPRRDGRIPAAFRRPSNGNHEASRIVNPMIPDLAVAARRLSAARRTHPYISRSDRTLSPGHACAARRKRPLHADGEIALRCRPRKPPSPQLGAEAAPIHIIACEAGTEWLRRGETAASQPDSDGHPMATRSVKDRPSDDAGPCRRCAAALSSAADAPTHISLGSHARSGLRKRRSPRRAVPCGHRNGASLSATDASNPAAWRRGSTHPDHRMRGRIRSLTAGDHRNANGWGPLRRGTPANARIGSSG